MGLIKDLVPLNLAEEKEKFFSDTAYNPQFVYQRSFSTEELRQWGSPKKPLYDLSLAMLKKHGPPLPPSAPAQAVSPEKVKQTIETLLNTLQINPLPITFSEHFLSQVMISDTGLHFRLPITFNQEQLIGKLDHEIQTHWLRRLNDSLQPWSKQSRLDTSFRLTEEGLANLHSYLYRQDVIQKKSFSNYVAAYLSETHSFRAVYQALVELGVHPDQAWNITLKKKRGIQDTSQPGTFTKDIVYLEGAIQVWHWLCDADHDPRDLYIGRVGLADLEQLKEKATHDGLIYPTFFTSLTDYRDRISFIGESNHFETVL